VQQHRHGHGRGEEEPRGCCLHFLPLCLFP
jgi:hypothetical protein